MNTISPISMNYNNSTSFKANGKKESKGFVKYCIKRMLPESKFYQQIERDMLQMDTEKASAYQRVSYMESKMLSTNIFFRAKEKVKHNINRIVTKLLDL